MARFWTRVGPFRRHKMSAADAEFWLRLEVALRKRFQELSLRLARMAFTAESSLSAMLERDWLWDSCRLDRTIWPFSSQLRLLPGDAGEDRPRPGWHRR